MTAPSTPKRRKRKAKRKKPWPPKELLLPSLATLRKLSEGPATEEAPTK